MAGQYDSPFMSYILFYIIYNLKNTRIKIIFYLDRIFIIKMSILLYMAYDALFGMYEL